MRLPVNNTSGPARTTCAVLTLVPLMILVAGSYAHADNDRCETAIDLPIPHAAVTVDTRSRLAWYRYTPDRPGLLTIDVAGASRIELNVTVGPCNGGSETIATDNGDKDDRVHAALAVEPGVTYVIEFSSFFGAVSDVTFDLGDPYPGPPNDDCDAPTVINSWQFHDEVDTTFAARDPDPASGSCSVEHGLRGVWYRFGADRAGTLQMNAFESDYVPEIIVYAGTCGDLSNSRCISGIYGAPLFIPAGSYLIQVVGPSIGMLRLDVQFEPTASSLCDGATEVSSLPFVDVSDADASGVDSPNVNPCSSPLPYTRITHQVWYKLVPTSNGVVSVNGSGTDAIYDVAAYAGECDRLVPLGCVANDHENVTFVPGASDLEFSAKANETYYVELQTRKYTVFNEDDNAGLVALHLEQYDPPPHPDNDRCATPVAADIPFSAVVDIGAATGDLQFGQVTVELDVRATASVQGLQIQLEYSPDRGSFVGQGDDVQCTTTSSAAFAKNDDDAHGALTLVMADAERLSFPINIRCKFQQVGDAAIDAGDLALHVIDVTQDDASGSTAVVSVGMRVL